MLQVIQIILIVMAITSGMVMLVAQDRMVRIVTLAGVFLIQFVILSFSTQWMISLTLLILGWMSCAVLGTGKSSVQNNQDPITTSEAAFRILAYLFFLVAVYFLGQKSSSLFNNLELNTAILGIGLTVSGLLVTGFSRPYYEVTYGLLIMLAGFEIIYYSLEMSLLVVGLIGAVKMGLAFIGSYWYIHYQEEEERL